MLIRWFWNTDKSFLTKQEAEDFVAGKSKSVPGPPFYGVAVGHVPGVYTEWTEAQKQINVKGPKYKKFETREEAEAFVKSGGKVVEGVKGVKAVKDQTEEPIAKRAKKSSSSGSKSRTLKVYTDGSALGNGRLGAVAGVGVYFGDGDKR